MRVRVLYHDHCFDGAASAAFFSRFYEGKYAPNATFEFTGLAHKASQLFEDSLFDGDVNAIVDFKYSPDPRLTWWFDHHQSAFLSPQDAEHFRHDTSGQKLYDPSYSSCTGFIAAVARDKFDYQAEDLAQLVEWDGYNKFIPYYLFPESTYTVSVSTQSFRTKVSVGSNPWAPKTPAHNLATICERYGGGGHPKVGAISFEVGAVEEARKVAAE